MSERADLMDWWIKKIDTRQQEWTVFINGASMLVPNKEVKRVEGVAFDRLMLEQQLNIFANWHFKNCDFPSTTSKLSFLRCVFEGCTFNRYQLIRQADEEVHRHVPADSGVLCASLSHCYFSGCEFSNLSLIEVTFDRCEIEKLTFLRPVSFLSLSFTNTDGLPKCENLDHLRPETDNWDKLDADLQASPLHWCERFLSWERLKTFGKLPLFSVSLATLVSIPLIFFLIAVYNDQVHKLREGFLTRAPEDHVALLIAKVAPIPLPALSLWLLLSTLLLGVASTLYTFFCPARIKEYSIEQWRHELKRPALTYLPFSWQHRYIRVVTGFFFLFGATGVSAILIVKLWNAAIFIWANSEASWWMR